MSVQFVAVIEKIKGLRGELFRAHSSFRAYEVLQEMRAPNIIGKEEASRNAKAIGDYKGFFNIAEHALNTDYLVSLAKLYDKHPDGTSLPKLLDYLKSNVSKLTVEDFVDYNKDRPDIDELKSVYVGINPPNITKIQAKLKTLDSELKKLKRVRDKHIAHLEMKNLEDLQGVKLPQDVKSSTSKDDNLTYGEINNLIGSADEILNTISSLVNKDIAEFSFLKETVTQDSEQLLKLVRDAYDEIPSGDIS